ncbi:MAG: hemA [Vampirovibrio sp.]|jgi:glutamyl-tRNA reductase|nr:hemA [Vampirovibrio sp.]
MHILVSGVRHRTAPIEVREKFALLEEEVAAALKILRSCAGVEECAILTTCNRTEIYAVVTDTELGLQSVKQFYKIFKGLDIAPYRQYTFNLLHEDAVAHLFRVASGLDSLIIGEGQIMGQVKDALAFAQREKTAGNLLDKLFKAALTVGKRVRTETGIADKDVSVSLAAYHFARQSDADLMNRRITLIGGGKMAEIMMSLFKQGMTPEQQANVVIVNRSRERLAELCGRYGFKGLGWERIDEAIEHADILFVATGAPHVVLGKADFEGKGQKLVIDIAVPRNVDPRVMELPDVQLFNTDNLAGAGGFSGDFQQQLKEQAQAILEEECINFQHWRMSLSVVPTLTRLREKVESIRKAELEASSVGTHYDVVDTISKNLIRKILHDPTVRLKNSRNLEDISQQASVLSHLFNIDSAAIESDVCEKPNVQRLDGTASA